MGGRGGLAGWRWIFILEGIATVVIAFVSWLVMPADLGSAPFFTEEEREFASEWTHLIMLAQTQLSFSIPVPSGSSEYIVCAFVRARPTHQNR